MARKSPDDTTDRTRRRTFLRAVGATGATLGGSALVVAQTESDVRVPRPRDAVSDADSTDASESLIDPDATIVLGAREEGWIGRNPPQIADEVNPTLDLRAGETYDLRWINLDGLKHNFVFVAADGTALCHTPPLSTEGAEDNLGFTANQILSTYRCDFHPATMEGAFRFPDATMTPTATPRRATETTLPGPAPRTPPPGSEPGTTLESPTETPPSYEVAAHFRLCGRVRGWLGRGPEQIDGTENPTLSLRPGERYSVTWENSDGFPHNFAILDREGDVVLQTEIMSTEGKRQWTMFVATEEMNEYRCAVHPSSMRGRIETTAGGTPTS